MDIKKIHQRLGKGDRVRFKGSDKTFFIKSAPSLDQDYVFVTNGEGTATYRKSLKNLTKHNDKEISLSESIKYSIRKILKEYHDLDEYVAKLSLRYDNMSYDELDELLGGKSEKKVGHNTIIHKNYDGDIAIKYHNTDIVTINRLDNIKLNNGNWYTSTTKGRLNQLVPPNVSIYAKKGEWRVKAANGEFPYKNGMIITADGNVLH